VTNVSESFSALATRLHVNPTKLCEYNFLYDCNAGVTPNNSIRVPYDQCSPKLGVWKCYNVSAHDTLLTVAASPESVILDALLLKNANLDILYGDTKLFPGQQLRLPVHICFSDEISDCHIVTSAKETLESIAATYGSTAEKLCTDNAHILFDRYCDPSLQPLPSMHVGMELTVPRLHATPPSPCKEIPGFWSCYTIKANDTIDGIGDEIGAAPDDLIELNYGNVDVTNCGECDNVTQCPLSLTDKQRGPWCLRIGQVLTYAVNECESKPGAWNCFKLQTSSTIYDVMDSANLSTFTRAFAFFCKANMRSIPSCRPNQKYPQPYGVAINQILKAPLTNCTPNDKSFCATVADYARGPYHDSEGGAADYSLSYWDGNGDVPVFDLWGDIYGEFHSPRGSLLGCTFGQYQTPQCTPVPGKHLCHKPLVAVGTHYGPSGFLFNWTDSIDNIAAQFGVDPKRLCKFNNLANFSQISGMCGGLKIPVVEASSTNAGSGYGNWHLATRPDGLVQGTGGGRGAPP
jgi:LysM repeat protein